MPYSNEQKANMVLALGAAGGDKRKAAKVYRKWHCGGRPSGNTIMRNYLTLKETGSFAKTRHRKGTISEEAQTDILAFVAANPHASVRDVTAEVGTSKSSVSRILRKAVMHPYHLQLLQKLEGMDLQRRLDFANWILLKTDEIPDFVDKVLWTDEAHFSRNAQVNIHNAHYWSDTNPHWVAQSKHQYQWSFSVWCGIFDGRIIEPVFIDHTLNAQRYLNDVLRGPVEDFLCNLPLGHLVATWFQHDGAPAHSSSLARAWLDGAFKGQWVGRHGPVAWPARSPDLTPLDFFLWGYVKDRVYRIPTTTPQALKAEIEKVCREIPASVVRKATANVLKRCQCCIVAEGDLFEHIL